VTEFVVITGLSGAGRSTVADAFEDLGWFVIDNLPMTLIEKVVELAVAPGSSIDRVALVVGTGQHRESVIPVVSDLQQAADGVKVLFLDATDQALVRRYESTRRRHPYASEGTGTLADVIAQERAQLDEVRSLADVVIDTTNLNIHQLRARIVERFSGSEPDGGMRTTILSFGYKHGIPVDADLVFDCRFLPNPHWVEPLRPLTGKALAVKEYVLGQDAAGPFLDRVDDLLEFLLPQFVAEGKAYLTVAIGCTGGRHRSVAISEELARRLRQHGHAPTVEHRDIEL
jgi:UPF0042 nucleotide-binding protein